MSEQLIVVDGYNIIRQWQEARFLSPGKELDPIREELIKHLASCAAYWDACCLLVFDAHLVPGGRGSRESHSPHLQVIFTKEGQTADSYIERLTAELQESGAAPIVCTSDWAEQNIVYARGAQRWSARDLLARVQQAEAEMNKMSKYPRIMQKSWLEEALSPELQRQMRRLRDSQPGKMKQLKKEE